jgi:hypothetical protein
MPDDITGAETQTATAEGQSEVTEETTKSLDTGAETDTDTAEGQGDEEEGGDENPDRGSHQLTMEERVVQLAEKRAEEKFAELQARHEAEQRSRQEEQQRQAKPFVEIDVDVINQERVRLEFLIEEARSENTVEGLRQAYKFKEDLDKLERAVVKNEEMRERWLKDQQVYAQNQAYEEAMMADFNETAEFYRQQKKIDPAVWMEGSKYIENLLATDLILRRQFQEKARRFGPIETISWIAEIAEKGLAEKAKVVQSKNEAKNKQVGGSGSSGSGKNNAATVDYSKMTSAEFAKFRNQQEAEKLKNRRR